MSDLTRLVTVISDAVGATYYRHSPVATPEDPADADLCEVCDNPAEYVTSGYEDPEFTTLVSGESGLCYCSACLTAAAKAQYKGFYSYYV